MDAMFDDYLSHLISDEAQSIMVESDWSYVDGYIMWFLKVSHLYMVQVALEDPLRLAHKEILGEEET